MEPREIINNGKEGAAMTQDYNLFEEMWFDTYREMMTIFLKQGGFVTEVSMQVSGDDLHLTLIGQKGNMLYMRLGDFFLGKTKPAIRGDYVVRARSVFDAATFGIVLARGMVVETANGRQNILEQVLVKMQVSNQESGRYGGRIVLSDIQANPAVLSIGLSSMAVPIRTVRVIASVQSLPAIRTGPVDSPSAIALRTVNGWESSQIPPGPPQRSALPLIPHADVGGQVTPYGWRSSGIQDVSLVCNYNTGIVYEITDSPWDLTGIKVLCSLEDGGLKRALSKTAKKRPFGQLELHYSSEKSKARLKAMNLKGEEGEREYEEATLRFKDVGLVYEREPGQHVACADYGTIFDQFLSTRQGNPSMGRAIATIKATDPEDEITELIGISNNDNLVVGFESRNLTIACTMSSLNRLAEFDDEYLGESRSADMQRSIRALDALHETETEAEEAEEPQIENSSSLYLKWKIYSDDWHSARGLPLPTDVGPVFMTYMNSGEMEQQDIDEYNRLLEE